MRQDVPIVLLGASHRTAGVEIRGRLASVKELLISRLRSTQGTGALRENVVVSTCNRLEVYGATEDAVDAKAEIERALRETLQYWFEAISPSFYTLHGSDAVRHLMRVAAGLDSRVLGETQILGQVSSAYREATAAGTAGRLLSRVFGSAIHAGRRAHAETGISRFPTSTSHMVTKVLKSRLGSLDGRKVLLIGAGKMAALAAQILPRHGTVELAFLNRTAEKANALAADCCGRVFTWDDLSSALAWADAAVVMTGALEPVVRLPDLRLRLSLQNREPLVIVDTAVPRNVELQVSFLPSIQLVDIDELDSKMDENLEKRKEMVPQVEQLIESEARMFMSWYHSRQVSPLIADLRRKVEQVAGSELEVALKGMEHLTPDHRKAIQLLVYRVTKKLLHEPTVRLKCAGAAAQDYSQVVRHLFALGESNVAAGDL